MALQNDNDEMLLEESYETINLDDLESKLDDEIENSLSELKILKEQKETIENPEALGTVVKDVIWEQFQNQIGVQAGEDFIVIEKDEKNSDYFKNYKKYGEKLSELDGYKWKNYKDFKEKYGAKTLDLRNEAHIQTAENFEHGKIATHNYKIDYQKRHDDWQRNFQKDEDGNVIIHETRAKREATLVEDARKPFDDNRPSGSKEKHTAMDHTISAAEIIRDPEANAHLSKEEQIKFANSEANLNEIDSSLNSSKSDLSMTDWLDNPNSKGQKPNEIFDIDEKTENQLRTKDREARKEYKKLKDEGKKRSIETGRQTQREEAFRIGKSALRAVVLNMLADLIKTIISKLVKWFKTKEKSFKTLLQSLKESIHTFVVGLKEKVISAGNTVITTITTAIFGPIVSTFKKIGILLKQGWTSLKNAVAYLKSPEAKNKPFSLVMLNVGKIVMAGLTATGALVLGEVIEKGLMSIPVFNIQIPLLGKLANILGIFFGAVVAGIIGAIALNLMDRAIAKKEKDRLQMQMLAQSEVVVSANVTKNWIVMNRAYEGFKKSAHQQIDNLERTQSNIESSSKKTNQSLDELDDVLRQF